MKVAAIQFFATPLAVEHNLQTAERLIRAAATQGAQAVVLPELFNTGYVYTPRLSAAAESEDGPTAQWLRRLSSELKILVGGALLWRESATKIYNAFVLADEAGRLHHYYKQHPFLWERCFFRAGDSPKIVETGLGRIGLLVCWDAAFRSAWEALRGQTDLILVSSTPPRFHRAALNFPQARKVYVAELFPEVLPIRDRMDDWYLGGMGRGAAYAGAPVASAVMAGRFVTAIPFPRLSFMLASAGQPRYWSWARSAPLATMRATFYGCSAVFTATGQAVAGAAGEEGLALAEVAAGPAAPRLPIADRYIFLHIPNRLLWFDGIMRAVAGGYKPYL
jgi:predicted amidohydrolase